MNRHTGRFARLSLAIVSLASAGLAACSSQNSDHTGAGGTGAGGTGAGGTNPGDSVLVARCAARGLDEQRRWAHRRSRRRGANCSVERDATNFGSSGITRMERLLW